MAAFRIINGFRNLSINNTPQRFKLVKICCQQKYFSSKLEKQPENAATNQKKKTTPIPKITLISPDESMQIVSLDEAQKISRRRDLKLVKIIDLDTKTQRPVFKLMTGSEYHSADLKRREMKKENKNENALKGEKLLLITSRITEHDLDSRMKNIVRWINKKYEVRVVITGESSNMETSENVYNLIEQKIKSDGRIVQKRTKGNELKFQIIPPKITKQKDENSETKTGL